MSVIQGVPFIIIFIGVLVTVHELGHFLVAKACGVKVLKFSIGFGPRIFGFRRGETEYQVAWVPLGGFVKMAGEQPHDEVSPEEAKRSFLNQPWYKRALIVAAGPAFNLAFPVLAYFFLFVGHNTMTAPRVGWVEPNMPADVAGLKAGDVVVSLDGHSVQSFVDVQELLAVRFERAIPLEVERDGKRVSLQVTPKRTTVSDPFETVDQGYIGFAAVAPVPFLGVPKGSAAEKAGLRTFDRVLAVAQEPVRDSVELKEALARHSGTFEVTVGRVEKVRAGATVVFRPDVVTVTVEKQEGEGYAALGAEPGDTYVFDVAEGSVAAKVGISEGDKLLSIDRRPIGSISFFRRFELGAQKREPFELSWLHDGETITKVVAQEQIVHNDELKTKTNELGVLGRSMVGDSLCYGPVEPKTEVSVGPGKAFTLAVRATGENIRKIALVFAQLLTGNIPFSTMGGPLALAQVATQSAELGAKVFIEQMAMVSINLGLVNLLPIPVLDGFALLSAFWEAVRRRPIPLRVREYANVVGLVLLVMLMVRVMWNDITRG